MFLTNQDYEVYKSVYKTMPNFNKNDKEFDPKYKEYIKNKNEKLLRIYKIINGEFQDEVPENLTKLIEIIKTNKLDIDVIHSYGCCLDDVSLPDHISTKEEIVSMIDQFEIFLEKYFSNELQPNIMTIARSSLDDYCPSDQVDFIQDEVLKRVKNYFSKQKEASPIGSIILSYLLE